LPRSATVKSITGANVEVGQRLPTGWIICYPEPKQYCNKAFGDDINDLYRIANQIRSEISDINASAILMLNSLSKPELKIKPGGRCLPDTVLISTALTHSLNMLSEASLFQMFMKRKAVPLVLRYNDEHAYN